MKDYIRNSKQVDLFSGVINHTCVESDFGNHPIVRFKTALNELISYVEDCVTAVFPKNNVNVGRKAFDPVFMLKVILAERRFGMTDNEMEVALRTDILINYLLDFESLGREARPSAKAIWKYQKLFEKHNLFEKIFNSSIEMNKDSFKDIMEKEDVIIDSSFNEAPKQRNTREENKTIKAGNGDTLWNDNKHKKCHKDIDARWTKKRGDTFYGYKAHAKCGSVSKVITSLCTTTASVHDSKVILPLLREEDKGKKLYLDAGYWHSSELPEACSKYSIEALVCEKGVRGTPLTEEQKKTNREKSKIRCVIEHAFGYIEQSMGGFVVRTIGRTRAEHNNYLTFAVYNISRWLQLKANPPGGTAS